MNEPREPGDAPVGAPNLASVVESLLFVSDQPLTGAAVAAVVERAEEDVHEVLLDLAARYEREDRGIRLHRLAGGWRLLTAEQNAGYVERLLLEGQSARLTQAALETLAVVAYLQPVGRARVAEVRGVNVDGVLRTLVTRGLVQVLDSDPDSGAHQYGTTPLFLEKLGLDSISDLPPLAPLLPGHEHAASVAAESSTEAAGAGNS